MAAESIGSKKTRRWVLVADAIADKAITIGGLAVIAAVLTIMVFLVYEIIPLFQGARIEGRHTYTLGKEAAQIKSLFTDDYNTLAVAVASDGSVSAWHLSSGKHISASGFDFNGKEVTAFAAAMDGIHIAAGFSDGTIRFGKVSFAIQILAEDEIPPGCTALDDRDSTDGRAIYTRIPGKQIRKIEPHVELETEITVSEDRRPIRTMDYRFAEVGERPVRTLVTCEDGGAVSLVVVSTKLNLFTRKATSEMSKIALPRLPPDASVAHALVDDGAKNVILAEKSGRVFRLAGTDSSHFVLAEVAQLTENDAQLTAIGYLLGDKSLVVGASDGSVKVFYLLSREGLNPPTADGKTLVATKIFQPHRAPVTVFAPSRGTRAFVTADSQGVIMLRHGTSEKTLLVLRVDKGEAGPISVALSTRLDGLLAVASQGLTDFWKLYVPHPEVSLKTLFGKVWYEGYPEPSYTWQSTGGTDAFEPKLCLVPLIFGTLKATFYSLIFAIPLALFAAVYTSEFLPPDTRATLKPIMEVMASLPSVVLGFVAALVLAPLVENWIAAVILAFVVIPFSVVAGAYLWQLLPMQTALALDGRPKFCFMALVVCLGIYISYLLGPLVEMALFSGNFKAWLNKDIGSATPLLFALNIPLVAGLLTYWFSRTWGYRFNHYIKSMPMPYAALVDLARWVVSVLVIGLIAYALALLMNLLGLDPRKSLFGAYVQRNTLIVGFAMGFAVVPIIYTLAEDALNAVPQHLRAASLGCGATPWQTAMWIVIPTALSGIFSATMTGMGRAVGETMIVVMATGNTPILDLNIFNGLRALSANIAVELPEAPKDGTLYRVLFLTGLVLFAMTFVINTIAELVRLRFRKKAMEL